MNGQVCSEEGVSLDTDYLETYGTGHASALAGTCLLRRTYYPNAAVQSDETWHELTLSTEQQQTLANLNWDGDNNAKQRMFVHELIVNIARQYTNHGVTLSDLVSEGKQGFIHALEKFQLKSDLCFSTYAIQCIVQYIERASMNRNTPPDFSQSKAARMVLFNNPVHKS